MIDSVWWLRLKARTSVTTFDIKFHTFSRQHQSTGKYKSRNHGVGQTWRLATMEHICQHFTASMNPKYFLGINNFISFRDSEANWFTLDGHKESFHDDQQLKIQKIFCLFFQFLCAGLTWHQSNSITDLFSLLRLHTSWLQSATCCCLKESHSWSSQLNRNFMQNLPPQHGDDAFC